MRRTPSTKRLPLIGAGGTATADRRRTRLRLIWPIDTGRGPTRSRRWCAVDATLAEPMVPGLPYTKAEAVYAAAPRWQ